MARPLVFMLLLPLLIACSEEDGGVTGKEPKQIIDGVEQRLDQAADTAEQNLNRALEKIDDES